MNGKKYLYQIGLFILFIILLPQSIYSQSQFDEELINNCINVTKKLLELQIKVKDIHPFLNKHFKRTCI